jgi:hypothetical protein
MYPLAVNELPFWLPSIETKMMLAHKDGRLGIIVITGTVLVSVSLVKPEVTVLATSSHRSGSVLRY